VRSGNTSQASAAVLKQEMPLIVHLRDQVGPSVNVHNNNDNDNDNDDNKNKNKNKNKNNNKHANAGQTE
jgi:hypothetical protein